MLARELESGTFRYAWTQAVGRMRWAVAALVPRRLGVAVIMAAFGAVVTWHNQPLVEAGITPRLHTTVFPVTGLAGAGWALAGFALGVLPRDCSGVASCPPSPPPSPPGSGWPC